MTKLDWRKFRSLLSKVHNIHVKLALREIRQAANHNTGLISSKKISLLNECLIDGDDTVQLALLKEIFFWIDLGYLERQIAPVASNPEKFSVKPGNDIPQLVVIFRKVKKSKSGNYQLVIPHYDGTRKPRISNHTKGNRTGILTLKDNSNLVVNAASDIEAERIIKQLRQYINPRYLTNNLKLTKRSGRTIAKDDYKAVRADYYPTGVENSIPKWRHYF